MPVFISIVVPVFRSQNTLPKLVDEIEKTLPAIVADYELLLVEDGGGDNSWQVIEQLAQEHESVRGIKLMRNYGQHAALLAGIRAASGDIVVTLDDDLQHPPAEIQRLVNRLNEGFDVVYGSPRDRQHSLWRNAASSITRLALSSAMGKEPARHASAFRAFRTHLRDAFAGYNSPNVAIDVLLTWGTTRFSYVEVAHHPRAEGKSTYTFSKLLNHALAMMTGFSILPLRFASYLGFGMTLFGILLLIYVIPVRLLILGYEGVPGFTFLASVIAIFSGAQMFVTGIIGEYLARMHFRLMDKPAYIIHQTTDAVRPAAISMNNEAQQSTHD